MNITEFSGLLADLPNPGQKNTIAGLPSSAQALCLASIMTSDRLLVAITSDVIQAERLWSETRFFLEYFYKANPDLVYCFPDWEILPYDHFSPHQEIVSQRLGSLKRLLDMPSGILIVPVTTLMQRLCPVEFIQQEAFVLRRGQVLNIDKLKTNLIAVGYELCQQVTVPGEFALRGALLDIFPMSVDEPFRLDLFDNEIETIRIFDPDTQLSVATIEEINILPAKEFPTNDAAIAKFRNRWRELFSGDPNQCPLYKAVSNGNWSAGVEFYLPLLVEKMSNLTDYWPANAVILHYNDTWTAAEQFWQEIKQRYFELNSDRLHPRLAPSELYLPPADLFANLHNLGQIKLTDQNNPELSIKPLPEFNFVAHQANPLHSVAEFITQQTNADNSWQIIFTIDTPGRREALTKLLNLTNIDSNIIKIIVSPITTGFVLTQSKIIFIAEQEITGHKAGGQISSRTRIRSRKREVAARQDFAAIKSLAELNINDLVVHLEHGIGRYLGLQTLTVQGLESEFVKLEYADSDRIYVPVQQLNQISRYTGVGDDKSITLHKLGSDKWSKTKKKALEQIRDTAAELLTIYAAREQHTGVACPQPDYEYQAFVNAFPFTETVDQLQVIKSIEQDLCSTKHMDRVICGDVGFGKTEVAMRAAFLVAHSGRQVAMLVPTTLLAQQHYETFLDRFSDFPFNIELISRFRTAKQQADIFAKLKSGKIDIIIGTHKLLNSSLDFDNLGLLIIDEEHRFGVRQKERLKALRLQVDILTLTATPIPRTLSMTLASIRDLSIIATPPLQRLAVKTFVLTYSRQLVMEAIQRELHRGGQVFYLHNNVATIQHKAHDLRAMLPNARIVVAHGQMRERDLESIMHNFYHRHYDILVCTTIIENGIDIPTANTMIIERADTFGLAQLHQLRGRVGRSHHQAYALLLIPQEISLLPADARQRLTAIVEHQHLGSGFALATQDLEIRGAGALLGDEQSGHIHALGYSLYIELLEEAVNKLRNGVNVEVASTSPDNAEINLQIPALIPDIYMPDVSMRLDFYQQINACKNMEELYNLRSTLEDRFGHIPEQLNYLLALAGLNLQCKQIGIVAIKGGDNGGYIKFVDKPKINPDKIINLLKNPEQFKLAGQDKLQFRYSSAGAKERLEYIEKLVASLLD